MLPFSRAFGAHRSVLKVPSQRIVPGPGWFETPVANRSVTKCFLVTLLAKPVRKLTEMISISFEKTSIYMG